MNKIIWKISLGPYFLVTLTNAQKESLRESISALISLKNFNWHIPSLCWFYKYLKIVIGIKPPFLYIVLISKQIPFCSPSTAQGNFKPACHNYGKLLLLRTNGIHFYHALVNTNQAKPQPLSGYRLNAMMTWSLVHTWRKYKREGEVIYVPNCFR